jgi:hypothetical protein
MMGELELTPAMSSSAGFATRVKSSCVERGRRKNEKGIFMIG